MNKYKYLLFSFLSIFFVLFYCSFNNDSHAAKKKPAPLKAPVQDECTPGPDPNACIEKEFDIGTPGSTIPWMNLEDCISEDGMRDAMIMEGGDCQYAYVDCSNDGMSYGIIDIGMGGRLVFLDQNVDVSIDTIYVLGGSAQLDNLPIGQLVIGTLTEKKKKLKDCPIESKITLEFTGEHLDPSNNDYLRRKGIIVEAGGELIMHGEKGVIPSENVTSNASSSNPVNNSGTDSWTYLAKPAGPDIMGVKRPVPTPEPNVPPATTLFLSKQTKVDWEENDWIVVAGTDFASHHSEFVQVLEVNEPDTVTLSHDTPLKYYHFGGPGPSDRPNEKIDTIKNNPTNCKQVDPKSDVPLNGISVQGLPKSFCDGPERNYGVDERAEVGLISRNIKLTSDAETTMSRHYGGQIRIEPDFTIVEIEGVEIEKFGQDIFKEEPSSQFMSAYPIHFHKAGELPNNCGDVAERPCVVINSNSIHHSYNKCITIHKTNDVFIENNICARAVGHSFYLETGMEVGNTFDRNLAIGAMATQWFPAKGSDGVAAFWEGDYLANDNNEMVPFWYDGFNVATTSHPNRNENSNPTAFWITNQQNTYENNSVSGCQLQGRGYWFLPANKDIAELPFFPFINNRVHGCYFGVDTATDLGALAPDVALLFPQEDDNGTIKNIFAVLDGITATRNRNRGIWARNAWFIIDDARLATNRDSVSLVSAGGLEGVPPGFWALLSNSVIVGISENNPERFGPCPMNDDGSCVGMGGFAGNAFPSPKWNFYGMMFYDGPARLETNRFVNFNVDIDKHLTTDDSTFLTNYTNSGPNDAPPYEGDAAMGWFQANDQSYPPTQYTLYNIWENVDFRHQIYTELVNIDTFNDGDKNTVILDRDSSLTGYIVVDSNGQQIEENEVVKFPISLNNLVFNGSPYTVDECLSIGAQDEMREQRETSLISPHSYATLEVQSWDPTFTTNGNPILLAKKKPITLIKDQLDYEGLPGEDHYSMTLHGRNDVQIYEPKVARGFGYTLHSTESQDVGASTVCDGGDNNGKPCQNNGDCTSGGTCDAARRIIAPPAAFPRFMSFSFTDAHSGKVEQNGAWGKPFKTRVGVCYKTERGPNVTNIEDPTKFFKVEKGRISYGGNTTGADPENWQVLPCNNFAFQIGSSFDPMGGTDPTLIMDECPSTPTTLTQAPSWEDFIDPNNDDKYFWDKDKGMLFFYMQQNEPPAGGFTPTGSCIEGSTDPACKNAKEFYPCPKEGCVIYTVRVVDQDNIGYAPTKGSQFVCDGGTLNGMACPATGVCPGGGICKPKPCKLCMSGDKKGMFCEGSADCDGATCMESPDGESCYGKTMCDDIYEGSTDPIGVEPPQNYTQTYPPNDTVNWQVDMLALPDGRLLTKDKIEQMSENMPMGLKFCTLNHDSIGKVCVEDANCGIAYGTNAQIPCEEKLLNFPYNEPKDEVKASCYPIMP